ncbi:hypothetical protein [uncultured Metabacillus sp.]|uniref:hypothetical protein n=1 Tax=uncultured Metabacillus sp. TaxID=2860135 RepID=UPI002614D7DF|nr:hypothetical protein [uncultured Metabacillus sp.]
MRKKGDKYRPVVTVLKANKLTPTKVLISGNEFVLKREEDEITKQDYINASRKVRRQRIELDNAYIKIEQLKKENLKLLEYKKAFEASKSAGVDLPYVKGIY